MSFRGAYDKPRRMRCRLALLISLALSACSSGDDTGPPPIPVLPWGSFRHDLGNSAIGFSLASNRGEVALVTAELGGTTISTPAVDSNDNVYVGTEDGLVSVNRRGDIRWRATACEIDTGSIPIGAVLSSPTVTPGDDVLFGSEPTASGPGGVFAFRQRNNTVECLWSFTPSGARPDFGVRSSPQTQLDPRDRSMLSVYIGTGAGYLQALNGNTGTPRWNFPISAPASGSITSTPAIDGTMVTYVTTPDGVLSAVDGSGRFRWQFPIGAPAPAVLQQSPAVATTIYALGATALFGINPDGTLKFQYSPPAAIPGSPAFLAQPIDVGPSAMTDIIIYLADTAGTLYGVRDGDGDIWQIQRCSLEPQRRCRMDSCLPDEGTCVNERCTLSDQQCTRDSCIGDDAGECLAQPAIVPASDSPISVTGSPVGSSDGFLVIGTTDGQVCVRALDGTVPGDEADPANPWFDGCVELGDGLPVLSSPAIGPDGRIFVTTATGLYVIE